MNRLFIIIMATLLPASAFAAVDIAVTTALGDLATDIAAIGGLVLLATIAIAVIKYSQAVVA